MRRTLLAGLVLALTTTTLAAGAEPLPSLVPAFSVPTASGAASIVPLSATRHGAAGAYALVHEYGDVSARAADGAFRWNRPAKGFFADWGVRGYLLPEVRAHAVDGEHLAVAHYAHWLDNGFRKGSFVTLLDVATGETLWTRGYPEEVGDLLLADGVLVVAHGATLDAVRFTGKPRDAWTFAAGAGLTLDRLDKDVVAAWSGHVARLDLRTGAVAWDVPVTAVPHAVAYDATRDRVVVLGVSDPAYEVRALDAATGATAGTPVVRTDATPFGLAVGDVDATTGAEWVVSETTAAGATVAAFDGGTGAERWRVAAGNPAPPSAVGWDPMVAEPRAVAVQDGTVLVATYVTNTEPSPLFTRRRYTGKSELRALTGTTGATRWSRTGDVLTPLALAPYEVDGRPAVLTATAHLVVHAYALADGAVLRQTPLLGEINAAEAADVNRDGVTDLLVGGQSEAVFALDGRTLGATPTVLWTAPADGEVHDIVATTLPTGERRLVVVAATAGTADSNQSYPVAAKSAVDVLDTDTGGRVARISTLPDFAWTATVTTLDGTPTVLVPTRTLSAYRVSDGALRWRYAPLPDVARDPVLNPVHFASPAVTAGGDVAVQWFAKAVVNAEGQRIQPTTTPNDHVVALLDGTTGTPRWQQPAVTPGHPHLWRGVATGATTKEGTPGIAVVYQVGQWGTPTQTEVAVHDAATGAVSYRQLLPRYYQGGAHVLPRNGLVTFGGIFEIVSVSPGAAVSRRTSPPPDDVAEARSGRYGDVLVTGDSLGRLGVFDVTPTATGFTRLADTATTLSGGRIVVRDLDGDGSDEVIQCSYDWAARNAAQNLYGAFSIAGGDGGLVGRGVDVYRLD